MDCPKGHHNADGLKFCSECAAPLPESVDSSLGQRLHRLSTPKRVVVLAVVLALGVGLVAGVEAAWRAVTGSDKPTQAEMRNRAYQACSKVWDGQYSPLDLEEDATANVHSMGGGDFYVDLGNGEWHEWRGECIVHRSGDHYEVGATRLIETDPDRTG